MSSPSLLLSVVLKGAAPETGGHEHAFPPERYHFTELRVPRLESTSGEPLPSLRCLIATPPYDSSLEFKGLSILKE
jgi:hypothetical protein